MKKDTPGSGAVRATLTAAAAMVAARSSQRITNNLLNNRRAASNNEPNIDPILLEEAAKESGNVQQQQRPRKNPFAVTKDDVGSVIDLTTPGSCLNFTPSEVRYDPSRTVGVGSIRMDSKKSQYSWASYDGWFLKNYREGEDPDYRYDIFHDKISVINSK